MNIPLRNMIPKLKNVFIYSFASGFCAGCFFTNECHLHFQGKNGIKRHFNLSIPLLTGAMVSTGTILSPLLIANYFCNCTYFDEWVDRYNITFRRFHQYNDKDNKYYRPSRFIIDIKYKI